VPAIDIPVTPGQAEWLRYKGKTAGVDGGVASGKTFIHSDWVGVLRAGEFPLSQSLIVGATRKQVKEGTLVTFKQRLDDIGIKYRENLSDLSIRLLNGPMRGHRIQAGWVENRAFLRFKSMEFDTIWCDEVQIWGNGHEALLYLFTRNRPSPWVASCVERVRRAHELGIEPDAKDLKYAAMQPQLRFSFNPPWTTTHWLHTTYIDPVDDEGNSTEGGKDDVGNEVRLFRWSTLDNTLLPRREEYIANLRKTMPPDVFRIEVLGESGDVGVGRAYTSFIKSRHTSAVPDLPHVAKVGDRYEIQYAPDRPLVWMHDFGVNPRVYNIGQVHRLPKPVAGYQDMLLYILAEAWIMNGDTLKAIGDFVERFPAGQWPRVFVYGDASGKNPSAPTGESDFGLLQSDPRLKPYRISIHKRDGNPPIVDRVVAVNTKLLNADDQIGVLFHPRVKRTITDFQQTRWIEGKRKLDHGSPAKGIFLTHLSDDVGYMIEREWPIKIRKAIRRTGQGTTIR